MPLHLSAFGIHPALIHLNWSALHSPDVSTLMLIDIPFQQIATTKFTWTAKLITEINAIIFAITLPKALNAFIRTGDIFSITVQADYRCFK